MACMTLSQHKLLCAACRAAPKTSRLRLTGVGGTTATQASGAPPTMAPMLVCERGGTGLGVRGRPEPFLMYRVDSGMATARSGVMAPALSHALQCAASFQRPRAWAEQGQQCGSGARRQMPPTCTYRKGAEGCCRAPNKTGETGAAPGSRVRASTAALWLIHKGRAIFLCVAGISKSREVPSHMAG